MTYFECTECGQLADLSKLTHEQFREQCPACEKVTIWKPAFDDEEVSL